MFGDRYHILSITSRSLMPNGRVEINDTFVDINLKRYQKSTQLSSKK